jgi:hypothetical protein
MASIARQKGRNFHKGRTADDLEHVGGRGLLLERLAYLTEQPRVLDRDNGLSAEILDQAAAISSR